jgi:saccharopine dehydrogenase-like NADP-dependent oxidoreductase
MLLAIQLMKLPVGNTLGKGIYRPRPDTALRQMATPGQGILERGIQRPMPKQMRVGIIGCGGVGQAIAQKLAVSPLVSDIVLADVNPRGAEFVKKRSKSDKITITACDASDVEQVGEISKKVDVVVNGAVPALNLKIMEGCLKGGASYIDMSNGDKEYGHPMFDDQLAYDKNFEDAGSIALCCLGIDPGASNIMVKRAADRMDSLEYVKVRDADTGKLEGYDFATYFSPESMLEEVIKDPLYWDDGKWGRSPSLEVTEVYDFPEPIGKMKLYRTDHEESELVPKFVGKPVKKVDFMISLDETFVKYVKVLKALGLTSFKPLDIRGNKVIPFEVVVAAMPRPDDLAGKIKGNAMVLTEVGGSMKGEDVAIRTWTWISHEKAHQICGIHATAYQTAMPVVVAVEMLARGEIKAKGVKPPECVDPVKFCDYLPEKDTPIFEEIVPLKSRKK